MCSGKARGRCDEGDKQRLSQTYEVPPHLIRKDLAMRVEKNKSPGITKNIKPLANTSFLPLPVLQYTGVVRRWISPNMGLKLCVALTLTR